MNPYLFLFILKILQNRTEILNECNESLQKFKVNVFQRTFFSYQSFRKRNGFTAQSLLLSESIA